MPDGELRPGEPFCARIAGHSILTCACMVEGGWLDCPPAVRGRTLPKIDAALEYLPSSKEAVVLRDLMSVAEFAAIAAPFLRDGTPTGTVAAPSNSAPATINTAFYRAPASSKRAKSLEARAAGFTGEFCSQCHSANMVRSGTCSTCIDCGATSGCS